MSWFKTILARDCCNRSGGVDPAIMGMVQFPAIANALKKGRYETLTYGGC